MEKLSEKLTKFYTTNILNEEIIKYYIDGFMDIFDIDFDNVNIKWLGISSIKNPIDNKNYKSNKVEISDKQNTYLLKFLRNKYNNRNWFRLEGLIQNVSFCYDVNNFTYHKINSNMPNLPIDLVINYQNNNDTYLLTAVKNIGYSTISLKSSSQSCMFSITRTDLEIILRIVMKFLEDPEHTIKAYKSILKEYNSYLLSSHMDPGMTDDTIILDKNGKILKKVIK